MVLVRKKNLHAPSLARPSSVRSDCTSLERIVIRKRPVCIVRPVVCVRDFIWIMFA